MLAKLLGSKCYSGAVRTDVSFDPENVRTEGTRSFGRLDQLQFRRPLPRRPLKLWDTQISLYHLFTRQFCTINDLCDNQHALNV